MAQDSRVTLERLTQFKTLQDQHNADTFLGIHDTADKVTILETTRTIDGVSFDGSTDITLPTKIIKVYSDNGTFYVDSAKETPFTASSYTNPEEKLFIDVTTGKSAYWNGTELQYIAAEDTIVRIAFSEKGAVNGVATLGNDIKVPNAQLPDFVDDVVEVAAADKVNGKIILYSDTGKTQLVTGEADKIYVDVNATIDGSYRWAGTDTGFVAINSNVSSANVVTKATNDADGNQIDTSYVKKETGKDLMTNEQSEQLAELVTKKNNRDLATVPEIDALFDGDQEIATVPTLSGTLIYNGSSQSPTFTNYDSNKLMLMGTTSAINAGTYSCYMTPAPGYKWSSTANPNGGKMPIYYQWSIGRINPIITTDKNVLELSNNKLSDSFTFEYTGDGQLSIGSTNTNVATININNNSITATAVNKGVCNVSISSSEGLNYNSGIKIVNIGAFLPASGKALNDYTWDEIKEISSSGLAANYFDIGDTKQIILNGTMGNNDIHTVTLNNYSTYIYILDFNHTEGVKGNVNGNHIVFGGFKTALTNGKDISLYRFKMNSTKYTSMLGWKAQGLRSYGLGNPHNADGYSIYYY